MHLGLMTPEWYADEPGGGIGTYCRVLAPAAAAMGHPVTVYAATVHTGRVSTRRGGVRVVPVFTPPRSGARAVAEAFRAAWHRTVAADRPDVIEAADFGGVAALVAGSPGLPPVTTRLHLPLAILLERGGERIYPDDADRQELERRQVAGSTLLTSPTNWLAGEAQRLWGLPAVPVTVPNPIAPDWLAGAVPARIRTRGPARVLYAGRLEHRKGVLTLAEAVARCLTARVPARFTFAGRDTTWRGQSVRDTMARRLSDVPDPAGYRFLPALRWPALRREIDRSDLVVVPSRYENFPYAALEALCRGRPVLATDGTGTAELMAGDESGWLVPPDDPEALSTALTACVTAPADLAAAGDRARRAVTRYLPDRVVPALLHRYAALRPVVEVTA